MIPIRQCGYNLIIAVFTALSMTIIMPTASSVILSISMMSFRRVIFCTDEVQNQQKQMQSNKRQNEIIKQ